MSKIKELSKDEYDLINPKIRYTVKKLREWGFETTDSGDSETRDFECDNPIAYVVIKVKPEDLVTETKRLTNILTTLIDFNKQPHPQYDPNGALLYPAIEGCFSPTQGNYSIITLFNIFIPETE